MSFEYTHPNGTRFQISGHDYTGTPQVQIDWFADDGRDVIVGGRAIMAKDAPAVALAILEAADVGKLGKVRLVAALSQLAQYQEDREREAEDAKVQEFRESSMTAIATVFNESNADSKDWDGLSATAREGWRARYRAARRFFEEA